MKDHIFSGIQKSSAHCYRGDGEEVNPRMCDQYSRPKTGISSCHTRPCQPRYYIEILYLSLHQVLLNVLESKRVYSIYKCTCMYVQHYSICCHFRFVHDNSVKNAK